MDANDLENVLHIYIYIMFIYIHVRAVVYTVVEYDEVKRFALLPLLQLRSIYLGVSPPKV